MSRVLRRRQAAEDIAEIWDFIAADNPAAADRWVDLLDQQFSLLARQLPGSYLSLPDLSGALPPAGGKPRPCEETAP